MSKKLDALAKKWLSHIFELQPYEGGDYIQFCKELKAVTKELAKQAGYSVKKWQNGHYSPDYVLVSPNGQLVYVSFRDVSSGETNWYFNILYRKMQDENDWSGRGDMNHFTPLESLPAVLTNIY